MITLLIALATCPAAVAQTSHTRLRSNQGAKVAGEVEALDRRLNEAFVRNDAAVLDEILAEDWYGPTPIVLMAEKAVALENFRKLQQAQAAERPQPDRKISINEAKVRIYGDTATVTGRYTLKDITGEYPWAIRFLDVFVKRRGRWRAVSSLQTITMTLRENDAAPLLNTNNPSPPPPSRKPN